MILRQRMPISWPAITPRTPTVARSILTQRAEDGSPAYLVQFVAATAAGVQGSGLILEQDGVRGIATTANKNHGGYGLDPLGMVRGQEKILLLAEHDHSTPLGVVTRLDPSPDELTFRASFEEPEDKTTAWAQRWNDAMARYRQGVLPGVSVGMIPNPESLDMEQGFPIFRQWALVELSLVAVGMDAGAVLQRQPPAAPPGAPAPPEGTLLVTFPNFKRT